MGLGKNNSNGVFDGRPPSRECANDRINENRRWRIMLFCYCVYLSAGNHRTDAAKLQIVRVIELFHHLRRRRLAPNGHFIAIGERRPAREVTDQHFARYFIRSCLVIQPVNGNHVLCNGRTDVRRLDDPSMECRRLTFRESFDVVRFGHMHRACCGEDCDARAEQYCCDQ